MISYYILTADYTYKWFILETEANKLTFKQNIAAVNLFETAPSLFRIETTPSVTVTGPGTYYVQAISPNGWKSAIREYTVLNAFPEGITASNNSPVDLGGTVALSIGQVLTATSYAWVGPTGSGFSSAVRNPTIAALAETQLGTYTVTVVSSAGCSFTATTTVTAANCDIYVQGFTTANVETTVLTRVPGGNTAGASFSNIKLKVLPFTGTSTFTAYNISWLYNGNPITVQPNGTWVAEPTSTILAGNIGPELTVNKPGKYTAILTLKSNTATTCTADIQISAVPCKTFADSLPCGTVPNIDLPATLAEGVSLAAGDKFTAGDYTVVITKITSGSPAAYIGSGYVEMKLVAGIIAKKIAVDFTNLVVNDCYEMASGKIVTQYDASWKGILSLDKPSVSQGGELQRLQQINEELGEELKALPGSCDQKNRIKKLIAEMDSINVQIQNSTIYTATEKTNLNTSFTNTKTIFTNILNCILCENANSKVKQPNCNAGDLTSAEQILISNADVYCGVGNLRTPPIYETDGHFSTVLLILLQLGMEFETAKAIAIEAENPDTDLNFKEREFIVDDTWGYARLQKIYHALNGGLHVLKN